MLYFINKTIVTMIRLPSPVYMFVYLALWYLTGGVDGN